MRLCLTWVLCCLHDIPSWANMIGAPAGWTVRFNRMSESRPGPWKGHPKRNLRSLGNYLQSDLNQVGHQLYMCMCVCIFHIYTHTQTYTYVCVYSDRQLRLKSNSRKCFCFLTLHKIAGSSNSSQKLNVRRWGRERKQPWDQERCFFRHQWKPLLQTFQMWDGSSILLLAS